MSHNFSYMVTRSSSSRDASKPSWLGPTSLLGCPQDSRPSWVRNGSPKMIWNLPFNEITMQSGFSSSSDLSNPGITMMGFALRSGISCQVSIGCLPYSPQSGLIPNVSKTGALNAIATDLGLRLPREVIKKKGRGAGLRFLVRWYGLPDNLTTWIPKKDIQDSEAFKVH
ncbi:hypothetical protein ADUPG1_013612 [Aduncisulcus paluster]|uniref:Chromo domain-containing protein n=1 Tax=Aduncisulcus paluster TaxID=2918883 RepID=A0ABQ5K3J2_9EUKA|nr:hypothetical protein ADUPG1_013612 [Aduncisulcus paluster]